MFCDVLFVPNKKKEIKKVYISKCNSERMEKVILLMIINDKRRHQFAAKIPIWVTTRYNMI